jgi:diguanylate cyclase (GGDEF)-like protein
MRCTHNRLRVRGRRAKRAISKRGTTVPSWAAEGLLRPANYRFSGKYPIRNTGRVLVWNGPERFAFRLPPLDLFTIKVTGLITVVVATLVIFCAWRMNRGVPGMRLLVAGLFSISFGGAVGILRLVIPGKPIILACNVFMLTGVVAVVQGVRGFRGIPAVPARVIAPAAVLVSAFFLYWLFGAESFVMRVVIISAVDALLCADAAHSMCRRVPASDRAAHWATGCGFALVALSFLVRTAGAAAGKMGHSFTTAGPIETVQTIISSVGSLGVMFGVVMISNTQARRESERMARFDPLTGLPNRRFLLERFAEAEQRVRTKEQKLGLIYMDLDRFKLVNDLLGHAVGDDLLRRIGDAIRRVPGAGQWASRIGGDEFVILIEDVEGRFSVTALAERLKGAIEKEAISPELKEPIRVSCGAAIFPEDGCSMDELMREADAAMYRAKRRNRRTDLATAS